MQSVGLAAFIILSPLSYCSETAQDVISGEVVRVRDGDTIEIAREKKSKTVIRLYGIDCPEKKYPYFQEAKEFTSNAVLGKTVSVSVKDVDRYGRTVGEVSLPDGTNLSHELVRNGLARWYRKYAPKDERLELAELEAQNQKLGIWGYHSLPEAERPKPIEDESLVSVVSVPPGAAIEVDNDFLGRAPLRIPKEKFIGKYVGVRASPTESGHCSQSKLIDPDRIPKTIYFQMSLCPIPQGEP